MSITSKSIVKNLRLLTEPRAETLIQSIELEEHEPSFFLSFTLFIISSLIAFSILWASSTQLEELTRAQGVIMPAGDVVQIANLSGGVASDILVREGEFVKAGDILAHLTPAGIRTGLDVQQKERIGFLFTLEHNRAIVESRQADFMSIPGAKKHAALLADAQKRYETEMRLSAQTLSILESQVFQKEESHRQITKRLSALKAEAAITEKERALKESIYKDGLTTRDRYYAAERENLVATRAAKEAESELAAAKEAIREAVTKKEEYESKVSKAAHDEIERLTQELGRNETQIAESTERTRQLALTSPVDGVVKGLTLQNAGAVVSPGQPVMEIVPVSEEMLVSARISPSEIGKIQKGQPVNIRVQTYDFARFGGIEGHVELLSATTFQDERGDVYYEALVALTTPFVGDPQGERRILPGMSVEVDIKTGSKSVLTYLLKPVTRGFNRAMHEN